jgi:hypothetical protein
MTDNTFDLTLDHCHETVPSKGLSHEIFGPVFWPVWIHLGLNMKRLWFLNINGAPLILYNYFKF